MNDSQPEYIPKILVPLIKDKGSLPIDIFRLNAPFSDTLHDVRALIIGVPMGADDRLLEEYVTLADGLLLQGGHDIHPRFFSPNEELHPKVHSVSEERDEFELDLIARACDRKMPILGVCRGAQLLNVAYGGTLYQHQPEQFPTKVMHFPNEEIDIKKVTEEDFTKIAHNVEITHNTHLKDIFQKNVIAANSLHHQSIKDIGKGLVVNAYAEDGVVEGIEHKDMDNHWVLGVQWHPEVHHKLPDNHKSIFDIFTEKAKAYRKKLL